ncbi:MAG: hypothetical protein ACI8RD_007357 [Bacillariaceae sp.]|jgi:hypothetical protein
MPKKTKLGLSQMSLFDGSNGKGSIKNAWSYDKNNPE